MSVVFENPECISDVICKNIKDRNIVFVFGTDIQKASWMQWCIKNSDVTGVKSVACEKFMAWDKFKENYAVSREENKIAISSVLRKFFVLDLINRNAKSCSSGNQLFLKIINPDFSQFSSAFSNSISNIIPSLKQWKTRFDEYKKNNPDYIDDDEDKDYLKLYDEYLNFLGDDFFDPFWQDVEFDDCGKKFILFYPDQLTDFSEYEDVFVKNENVVVYKIKKSSKLNSCVYKYSDSRKEMRRTFLKIRDIVERSEGKILYTDIALHVPGLDNVCSYIEREAEKYNVPYVLRQGKSFFNNAALIFDQIKNCYEENFSYNSLRSFLLNGYVPWKNEELNNALIREGSRLHTVCNFSDDPHKDVWAKSLSSVKENDEILKYYFEIKNTVKSFCLAKSFNDILKAWNIFKNEFLAVENFTEETDQILSRCVKELQKIIDIENSFDFIKEMKIGNVFDFYLNELRDLRYAPQKKINGISVFDYKVAAGTAFKYHFVINCNQKMLSQNYMPLKFLTSLKRQMLSFTDSDEATRVFMELYGFSKNVIFSYAENSFDGFAIPHSYFKESSDDLENPFSELDKKDFNLCEKEFFNLNGNSSLLTSSKQIEEYNQWKNTSDYTQLNCDEGESDFVNNMVLEYAVKNRSKENPFVDTQNPLEVENEKIKAEEKHVLVSHSDLDAFYPCARKWLYSRVLKLKEDSLDTNLFDKYIEGTLYHKVLEEFFGEYKKTGEALPVCYKYNGFANFEDDIKAKINGAVYKVLSDYSKDYTQSFLQHEILISRKEDFEKHVYGFLKSFLKETEENGFGGCRVFAMEKYYSACKKEFKDSFMFMGILDCVLQDANGESYIVDFKTTEIPSASECYVNQKVSDSDKFVLKKNQGLMYVTLWNLNHEEVNAVSTMSFWSLKNYKGNIVYPNSKVDASVVENTKKFLDSMCNNFAQRIRNRNLVPEGNSDEFLNVVPQTDCSLCNFKSICRTSYVVGSHNIKN